jgi:hypothetical protein
MGLCQSFVADKSLVLPKADNAAGRRASHIGDARFALAQRGPSPFWVEMIHPSDPLCPPRPAIKAGANRDR